MKKYTRILALKNPIHWLFIIIKLMFSIGFIIIVNSDPLFANIHLILKIILNIIILLPFILDIALFLYLLIKNIINPHIYLLWEFIIWIGAVWIIFIMSIIMFYDQLKNVLIIGEIIIISFIIYLFLYIYNLYVIWPKRIKKWKVKEYLLNKKILDEKLSLYNVNSDWEKQLIHKNRKKEHWWDKNTFLIGSICISIINVINVLNVQQSLNLNKRIIAAFCGLFISFLGCEGIATKWIKYKFINRLDKEYKDGLKAM